tara:strand:+ start:63714 stop:64070 length:357 start_codon:yes stop_codon:yes gene_type:complete
MHEFLIMIHRDLTSKNPKPSPDQLKSAMKPYQEWIAGIGAEDQLVGTPKRWDLEGFVIQQGKKEVKISNGPFGTGNNSIGGLFLIKADTYDEAVKIAEECPIIQYGAVVEVRMAMPVA